LPLLKSETGKFNFVLVFGTICAVAVFVILCAFCVIVNQSTSEDEELFDEGKMEELNKELIVFSSDKSSYAKEDYI
jgi:hypothetical protein